MASVNKVIVLGNLGKDPELRYTPADTAVVSISVATSRNWKNKDSGERMEETEWHRVVAYDRLAEIIGEYCKKGKPIYIEGRLKTRKWQDKDGRDVYTTEIVCEHMQLLGGREDGDGGERSRAPAPAPRQQRQAPAPQSRGSSGFDDMDDDILF